MAEPSQRIGKGRTLARIGAGMSLLMSLLHCGSGTTAPPPAPRAERPAPAPSTDALPATPKPAESAQAPAVDKPTAKKPVAATKDPAIAAMSAQERYALAKARLPGIAELTREAPKLDFSRFGKEGATVALYVPESVLSNGADTSKRCRRAVFAVHPNRLSTQVPTNGGEGQPELKAPASFNELVLDRRVTTFATVSRSFERNAKGERIEVGQGIGGFENHGGELLAIRDDAVAYGAVAVGVHAVCATFEERPCARVDGTGGVCERCTKLDIALSSRGMGHGFSRVKPSRVGAYVTELAPVPDCAACPADALSQEILRLDQALEGMTFYTTVSEPWPVISLKKETCEAAERAHAQP